MPVTPLSYFLRTSQSESMEKSKRKAVAPYMYVEHSVYRDEPLCDIMRGKTELYFYLRTWIIRGEMGADKNKLDLLKNYFNKGFLAASLAVSKLAKDLHIGTDKVTCYLRALNYYGIIETEKVSAKDSWDKKSHHIYVFGTHNFDTEETYYIDTILL